MIDVRELEIPGVREIRSPRYQDERGFFSESWNAATWSEAGVDLSFVQDNHSLSLDRGVLRGLHFQLPPVDQDKLVRVTRGAVFDVAVDVRQSSRTFGKWVGLVVSAAEWNQILIPSGFAHGFVTLEPDTEVQYKVTAPYSPELERTIRYDDPDIGIDWPITGNQLILSAKDRAAPPLSEVETGF